MILVHLLTIIILAYGLAIILVEKKRSWPVRRYVLILKKLLGKLHRRMPKMLNCTVCTSFWTALIAELFVLLISLLLGFHICWLWPLSGFASAAFTWTIMDFLNTIAKISEK